MGIAVPVGQPAFFAIGAIEPTLGGKALAVAALLRAGECTAGERKADWEKIDDSPRLVAAVASRIRTADSNRLRDRRP